MTIVYTKVDEKSQKTSWVTVDQDGTTITQEANATWTDRADGFHNPTWRWRTTRNLPATTPFTAEKRSVVIRKAELGGGWFVSDTHNSANYREFIGRGQNSLSIAFGGNPSGIDDSSAMQQALGQFWAGCSRARNAIQGGTLIGELGETIRMVKGRGDAMMHLFTNWNTGLRKAKKKYRLRKDRRRAAADAWLEFAFGWAPLANDITGALSVYAEPRREVKRVHGNGRSASTILVSPGSDFVVGPIIAKRDVTRTVTEVTVRYKGCIAGETAGLGGVADRLGVLPADFIPTLWELLPWSFLVDYFTNVGGCINALCFPRGLIKWINLTVRKASQRQVDLVYNRPSDSASVKRNTIFTRTTPGGYTSTRRTVVRSNVDPESLPNQNLQLEVPGGLGKWVNMSALAAARAYKYWP